MENRFRRLLCRSLAFLALEGPCELQGMISIGFQTICQAGAYQMLDVMLTVDYEQRDDEDDRCLLFLPIVDRKQYVAHQ